ncbi:MAG TPA: alkaline phosphatase, partial [Vicinamibacteria bacterium]|nr:alkaline phosphatase [Vicinamibacteria bacterium]
MRTGLLGIVLSACIVPAVAADSISLVPLGAFQHGGFAEGAAEIPAYDAATRRVFVVNAQAARVDVLDLSDPSHLTQVGTLEVTAHGAVANSVAAHQGLVAVAVEAAVKTDPGRVVFFSAAGQFLASVQVGALPDMVAFTPDGRWLLVANEGEPDDSYTADPEGSVSVIDVSRGGASVTQADVRTAGFGAFDGGPLPPSVRVFGPSASASRDFEPEYIAVAHDSRLAWVTLQENNAVATLDVAAARILAI